MNMKKTIAAIAAGAVAVSAMATTVSALADTTLTYNLVKKYEVKKTDVTTATYEFTVNAAAPVEGEEGSAATYVWANAAGETTDAAAPTAATDTLTYYAVEDAQTAGTFFWADSDTATAPTTATLSAAAPTADDQTLVFTAEEDQPAVEEVPAVEYPTEINFTSPDTVKSVVLKVASNAAGEQNKVYTYSTDPGALNYNAGLSNTGLKLTNELTGYEGALALTITVNTETAFDEIAKINAAIVGGTIKTTTDNATAITVKAFTKGGEKTTEYFAPFKTEIKKNANITAYLEGNGYHNVGAVLNDAIENYESVTFTFNTATQGIVWTVDNKDENYFDFVYGRNDAWAEDSNGMKKGGTYSEALAKLGQDPWNQENEPASMLALYSDAWFADNSYKSFDQHLYNGGYTNTLYGTYITSYGSEATGYTGFDWTGYNLFQGALVINENLTMSLAETDYFDWTATSLSFDWDAIMDGAMTSNDYAVYLHSMKLATSNTWYWDNMAVTLTAGAADDATSDAGVEADDEELAEEEVEEEVVEEEVEEEVEVSNPTTGNASVALAVIPVALAAAAVVAKKRS